MNIEEKLLKTRFVVDSPHAHIKVNTALCAHCHHTACIFVCPVQCYKKIDEKLSFSWENCLECGSCRIVCTPGAIEWNYPRGGFGVCYRFG